MNNDSLHSEPRGGQSPRATAESEAASWVYEHGDSLYNYAFARVHRPEVAEDLVQETFLAAVRNYEKFCGRSSARTWLFGILKHKLIEHYRNAEREASHLGLAFFSDELSEKFSAEGFWRHQDGPKDWTLRGADTIERAEFWRAMRECLSKMPCRVAAVFTMRELDDVPRDEICAALGISQANLSVMLHRARMALRDYLENALFERESANGPGLAAKSGN